MIATAEQERKALAQIKKIVDGLGEDSYIGAAFAGCFELAEYNIANDYCESMTDKLECADRTIADLKKQLCKIEDDYTKLSKESESLSTSAQALIDDARKRTLPLGVMQSLAAHLEKDIETSTASMLSAAATMARLAEFPQDIAFKKAVNNFNEQQTHKASCEEHLRIIKAAIAQAMSK